MIPSVLSQRLVLLVIGLAAGSGILIPASYGSFHPVTSGEIADETILSVDIKNGEVKNADIGGSAVNSAKIAAGGVANSDIATNAVTGNKIADGTISYGDVSRSLIAVEHRDDCNCGGTGWDPDGTSSTEIIHDSRITPNSVVAITAVAVNITCSTFTAFTLGSSPIAVVTCEETIPNGMGINYSIFNNPAYG